MEFIVKNNVEQLFDLLNKNNDVEDYKQIGLEVFEKFNIQELLQLDEMAALDLRIKYVLESYPRNWQLRSLQKLNEDLDRKSNSLNTVEFIFYMLNVKNSLRKYSPITETFAELLIEISKRLDLRLIQKIAILKVELNDQLSYKLSIGLFLIFEKSKAINMFRNFISRYSSNKNFNRHFFMLIILLEESLNFLEIDHIPVINDRNFESNSIFINENNEFIKISDLKEIVNNRDYFKKKIPLKGLDLKYFLDKNIDFQNFERFRGILDSFFSHYIRGRKVSRIVEKLDLKQSERKSLKIDGVSITDIFIENITSPYPIYSKDMLIEVKICLHNAFDDKATLQLFLALFYNFIELGVISNLPGNILVGKIINIMNEYLPKDIYSESTIKDLLSRSVVSKTYASNRQNAYNYFL